MKKVQFNQMPCPVCAEPLPIPITTACGSCVKVKRYYHKIWAPYLYQTPLKESLIRLKYGHKLDPLSAIAILIQQICPQMLKALRQHDIMVPMPIFKARLVDRGFNQAHEIAKILTTLIHVPLDWQLCTRVKMLKPQSECNKLRRQKNIHASDFHVLSDVKDKKVLIIDDVVTTTASSNAFAQALCQQGASQVNVFALCRTSKL